MALHGAYVDHLRGIHLFQGFARRDLEKIARVSEVVDMPAGTVLTEEGSPGHEAYVLLEGEVIIKRNGRKVSELSQGSILGELSLLDKGPRTATAICETDCRLLLLTQPTFLGVVDQVPALSQKLLASLAGRIRDLDRQTYG